MDKIHTYWKKIVLAAAIVAAVGSLGAPQGALAASAYDDVVAKGDFDVRWGCGSTPNCATELPVGTPTDIYGDHQIRLNASTNSTCIAAYSYWSTERTNTGFWEYASQMNRHAQSGYSTVGENEAKLEVVWTFGKSPTTPNATFAGTAPGNRSLGFSTPSGTTSYTITYSKNKNGSFSLSCQLNFVSAAISSIHGTYGRTYKSLFVRGINITYPTGYTGKTPGENYVRPVPPNPITPNIVLRGVLDWKGEFSDDNFLTFDATPFLCEEDLAPVIRGEVWDERGTPVILDTFVANATGLFKVEFPRDTNDSDYRIVSWYDCDDGVNEFPNAGHYTFTITGYGQLKNEDLFATCVDANFPFLHPQNCLENMFTVINLLKFGNASFGGNWSSPGGCYTLVYIDDWINRPGQVVCPAVKGTVRTLMTPVVLFLLALAMVRVINRHNERRP